ncbi:hypothetical protein [Ruminococcus albus]|uniref:hypothetical protein n=1 Tax=Ruminococcus albus TaxID=1264 RepID=UPI0009437BCE|nr:hypothetical protein [Ruminococcus albus]
MNAQFSLNEEHLAFPICSQKSEQDGMMIYPYPAPLIVSKLKKCSSRMKLLDDFPDALGYDIK